MEEANDKVQQRLCARRSALSVCAGALCEHRFVRLNPRHPLRSQSTSSSSSLGLWLRSRFWVLLDVLNQVLGVRVNFDSNFNSKISIPISILKFSQWNYPQSHLVFTLSLGLPFIPYPLFSVVSAKKRHFNLHLSMKCWNSAFYAQGSRLVLCFFLTLYR
jgi:hypothetical protein